MSAVFSAFFENNISSDNIYLWKMCCISSFYSQLSDREVCFVFLVLFSMYHHIFAFR